MPPGLQKRIDFSIDVFSPYIDVTRSSPHIKRRVWQETISTILLASPGLKMPEEQVVSYSEPRGKLWPPYLIDFRGFPSERHAENLKVRYGVIFDQSKAI